MVFIDPTDCSIPFSLIEAISNTLRNADFIINIATGTDLTRNIRRAILDPHFIKAKRKYISFLGSSNYFDNSAVITAAKQDDHRSMRNIFMEEYKRNLNSIGYNYIGNERVLHYYELLFASKNKLGLRFWREAQKIEPSGQSRFNF